jgi:bifunctional non-homologous end joining protein LigD
MAQQIEAQSPERVISKMAKQLRAGKVFVDWGQNDPHKTTVCVYSLRARERPTVSTPITWQEVGRAARRGSADELIFGPDQVLARVARHGDLFAPVLELKQRLPRLRPSAKRPH